jgi:predicted amidohydrolase
MDHMNMPDRVKVAGAQMEPRLMQPAENIATMLRLARKAAAARADLIVFPECCLTGYQFSSRNEAIRFGQAVPGPATEEISSVCKENKVYIVFGLLENECNRLFNTAVLLGPEGFIGKYRKNHIPHIGVDRFVDPGDLPFRVFKTPIGNIGIEICYDIMFPEASRILALQGADIVTVPTNYSPLPWGRGERITSYVVPTRAVENRVHVVAVDRIGTEGGFTFVGRSKIINALGEILAEARQHTEDVIYGEVSLAMARQKQTVVIPNEWEVNGMEDRRPELYGDLTTTKPE